MQTVDSEKAFAPYTDDEHALPKAPLGVSYVTRIRQKRSQWFSWKIAILTGVIILLVTARLVEGPIKAQWRRKTNDNPNYPLAPPTSLEEYVKSVSIELLPDHTDLYLQGYNTDSNQRFTCSHCRLPGSCPLVPRRPRRHLFSQRSSRLRCVCKSSDSRRVCRSVREWRRKSSSVRSRLGGHNPCAEGREWHVPLHTSRDCEDRSETQSWITLVCAFVESGWKNSC